MKRYALALAILAAGILANLAPAPDYTSARQTPPTIEELRHDLP